MDSLTNMQRERERERERDLSLKEIKIRCVSAINLLTGKRLGTKKT